MLKFNSFGHLTPAKPIKTDLNEFEATFVLNIENEKRKKLFENYQKYNQLLGQLLQSDFYQWIDGSFVTKKQEPNDIDVVTFIDHKIAKKYKEELKEFLYPQSNEKYGIDGYLVREFEQSHRSYFGFTSDRSYWWNLFEKVKSNKKQKLKKGFLEIHFKHLDYAN